MAKIFCPRNLCDITYAASCDHDTDPDKYDIIRSVRKGQQLPSSQGSKITIVTGSTRGIGLAKAIELADNIDTTTIVCSRQEEITKVIACLASNNFSFAGGNAIIVDDSTGFVVSFL